MPELNLWLVEFPTEMDDSIVHLSRKVNQSKDRVLKLNAKLVQFTNKLGKFLLVFSNLFFDLISFF